MRVDAQTAQHYIDCGWAFSLGRGTIVLRKTTPLKLRDASCAIRESTIIAAASGSKYHRSLIQEAWA